MTKELHGHEYTQINYVYEGNCCHVIGSMIYEVSEGDVFVIPPYTPHRIIASGDAPLTIIEIEFNPELITQDFSYDATCALLLDFFFLEPYLAFSETNVRSNLKLYDNIRVRLEEFMLSIVREFEERQNGFELMVKSAIISLTVQLGRLYQNSERSESSNATLQRHHASTDKAIKYIEQCYQERLSVEEVAKISMLSTSYFCYIFKSITHKTFVEYINDLRIQKSKEFLTKTQKSVGDICFDVGFNNISHFNHLFKLSVGLSPSMFRRANRMKSEPGY